MKLFRMVMEGEVVRVLISIVTVTYNNYSGLKRTLDSVKRQSYDKCEHLIIDGGSDDGSAEYLNKNKGERMVVVSEADSGIFNAMNKGISLARGEWLIFLNAGDIFPNDETLADIFKKGYFADSDLDILYGDKIDGNGVLIKARSELSCLYYGEMPACHQSIFFRKNIEYDDSYKVYGDIDLMSKIYLSKPKFQYVSIPVSVYEGGGVSSKVSWLKRKEKLRSLYKNFGLLCVLRNYALSVSFYGKVFRSVFKG